MSWQHPMKSTCVFLACWFQLFQSHLLTKLCNFCVANKCDSDSNNLMVLKKTNKYQKVCHIWEYET
jgi:hypothetical protein